MKKARTQEGKGDSLGEERKESAVGNDMAITNTTFTRALPTQQVIGYDSDDVMKLLQTVIESTKAGVPLETQLLGRVGAESQPLPEDFIKDLIETQKDKVNFIGSLGGSSVLQSRELSRHDKINLLKLGLGKGLLDKETEAKLLSAEPSLEKELSTKTATEISLKFLIFKPIQAESGVLKSLTKMFLTFKFFTFAEFNTTDCFLVDTDEEEKGKEITKMKPNKTYLLKRETADRDEVRDDDKYTCRAEFKIDPSASHVKNEHISFVKYCRDRMLHVDFFDAYSKLHIGIAKIPLFHLLRQGKDIHSKAQE